MAYRTAVRLSRNQQYSTYYGRINIGPAFTSVQLTSGSQQRKYHNGQSENQGGQQGANGKWSRCFRVGVGFVIAAPVIVAGLSTQSLLAEDDEKKAIDVETIYRKTQTLDKIFDYFCTYRYINQKGKKVNLMSTKDFYNAVTPGSTITHGTGLISAADYTIVTDNDIHSEKLIKSEEIPAPNSILNKIQKEGLLSYTDFCFLMNILAIPRRYLDITFLAMDLTNEGKIEAKEYLKVMTKIAKHTGGMRRFVECGTPEKLMNASYSGLMNYLFGEDRSQKMTKEAFLNFRGHVIDDILWLEFTRYCKGLPDLPKLQNAKIITDVEFCEHLLANANIPSKKKKAMIRKVTKFFGETSTNPTALYEGITFEMFKSFYHVLFCGEDFERSMYFLDAEKGGVNREEFISISKKISDMEVDSHIVDVVFLLLDEDEDQRISIEKFDPLLSDWRHSRAFAQAAYPGAAIMDLKLT